MASLILVKFRKSEKSTVTSRCSPPSVTFFRSNSDAIAGETTLPNKSRTRSICQASAHLIEGGGKRSDFILLLKLNAVIVISGRNLTRTAGQLQYRSGNAARDPHAKYGGYAQA
jgi:hypothetical protein